MDFLGSESYIVWLQIVISVIALAIILERAFFFWKVQTDRNNLVRDIKLVLSDTPNSEKIKAAAQVTNRLLPNNPLAYTLHVILENAFRTKPELENLVELEVEKQTIPYERFLTTLSTIATVSPLLGLLGTVVGMIKSFLVIAQGDIGQGSVASGISEALITTAVGLVIAIPATVSYNYFVRKIEKIFRDVSVGASEVINHLK